MTRSFFTGERLLVPLVSVLVVVTGCDDGSASSDAEVRNADAHASSVGSAVKPDGTLKTHEIVPSTPTAEGLAYIEAVADVLRSADGQDGEARIATLRRGMALQVPADLPEAEILRLQLATRIAEAQLQADPTAARDQLAPMLDPKRSIPLDRASAQALIVLGDAATRTGDDALAAGAYARSIRMMSILREELE
ncbi:MAG: hypothetical protein AAGA54_29500 [Myxococcota bacterium]